MSSSTREIKSVSTSELYDRWAQVYDTDGNILQAIDDILFPTLLSQALTALMTRDNESGSDGITITELGCGTGRNTAKLLTKPRIQEIHALDLSASMLALAERRCLNSELHSGTRPRLGFHQFDALRPAVELKKSFAGKADLVISTLVIEHLPLDIFFESVSSFLKRDEQRENSGFLVITNMHPDLGNKSRAGFTDPITGLKIQGESYAHTIPDVLDAAAKYGFLLVGEVMERVVEEADVGEEGEKKLLGPRGKKWIGVGVWFGMVLSFDARAGRT